MIFLLFGFVVLICAQARRLKSRFIKSTPTCFSLFDSITVNLFFSFEKMTFLSLGFVVLMFAPSLVTGKDVGKNLVFAFFDPGFSHNR